MELPLLAQPDSYVISEPPWLPPALSPLCFVLPMLWQSRAFPLVDIWFLARVPWKLIVPVRPSPMTIIV